MMWPSVEQNKSLKIFGEDNQDKLGLYGNLPKSKSVVNLPPLQPPAAPKLGNLESVKNTNKAPVMAKSLQNKINEMRSSRRNSITSAKGLPNDITNLEIKTGGSASGHEGGDRSDPVQDRMSEHFKFSKHYETQNDEGYGYGKQIPKANI